SWGGADSDPAGALSDIVQRMLGAGYFNYDFVTYTVAPPVYAQQPNAAPGDLQQADTVPGSGTYPVCLDCTFIGYQEIIIAPPRFHGRRFLRDEGGICGIRAPCAEANKTHAMALAMRSSAPAPVLTPPLGRPANVGNPSEPRRRAATSGGGPAVSTPTRA